MKFHHIGYLVNNFNSAIKDFRKFNYKKKQSIITDSNLKVQIQFLVNGNNIIELVKPHKKNIGLLSLLKKKNYAYHFAYKVRNLDKILARLKKILRLLLILCQPKHLIIKKLPF